jgi:hypothetical protein
VNLDDLTSHMKGYADLRRLQAVQSIIASLIIGQTNTLVRLSVNDLCSHVKTDTQSLICIPIKQVIFARERHFIIGSRETFPQLTNN